MAARKEWDLKPVADRAQIFLKAADMLSGPHRAEILAKTMVGQVRCLWAQLGEGVAGSCTLCNSADINWAASGCQDLLCWLETERSSRDRAEERGQTHITCEIKCTVLSLVSYGNVPSPPSLSPCLGQAFVELCLDCELPCVVLSALSDPVTLRGFSDTSRWSL